MVGLWTRSVAGNQPFVERTIQCSCQSSSPSPSTVHIHMRSYSFWQLLSQKQPFILPLNQLVRMSTRGPTSVLCPLIWHRLPPWSSLSRKPLDIALTSTDAQSLLPYPSIWHRLLLCPATPSCLPNDNRLVRSVGCTHSAESS
jgi:hypothetical protein